AKVYAKSNSVKNILPELPNETIAIEKVWEGPALDRISYEVYKLGLTNPVASGEITAADGWKKSLDLPKYDPVTREENVYLV
ncbi:hypothetical protein ACXWOO_11020, partial [Streptococcus pyogenes]